MTDTADLFGQMTLPQPLPQRAFDGRTYQPERDHARLSGLLSRVFNLMQDGRWRTLNEIAHAAGGSQASVSARLRDLRKAKYGSRTVERQHIGSGLFQYRISNPRPPLGHVAST